MVASETFAGFELRDAASTVLAPVTVPREQERVGHLPAEATRHVDELGEPDYDRAGQRQTLRADYTLGIGFHHLGLAVNHEAQRAPHRHHR